ncbi:MAG: hypothetical protein JWQ81_1645 [Amycolatopsis sp.]|uniref:hypothetical protein n=1 Tax=Amycolatopsis sp. TaxID=37632 RepID=UPI002619DEE8|nr:hypothetical protein [Amycolatopsis sp.]MCU1680906.1 hypothetical protein [Amycolatopsis sp.]
MLELEPLMPAVHRFPVNLTAPLKSAEKPSSARPFILRGVTARPVTPLPMLGSGQTSPGQTLVPRECNQDGKLIDDSYTVPDQ